MSPQSLRSVLTSCFQPGCQHISSLSRRSLSDLESRRPLKEAFTVINRKPADFFSCLQPRTSDPLSLALAHVQHCLVSFWVQLDQDIQRMVLLCHHLSERCCNKIPPLITTLSSGVFLQLPTNETYHVPCVCVQLLQRDQTRICLVTRHQFACTVSDKLVVCCSSNHGCILGFKL